MTRTRAPAPKAISRFAIVSALLAIAASSTLDGCSRDPVEPKLVGSWQTAIASPAGPYQLRLTTAASGQYRVDAQGPAPVPPETGSLKAAGGKWRREKQSGGSDEGTYEFLSADTVLFKSKTETFLWNRIPNDVAAAKAPPGAASGNVAPGPFAAVSAGGAQPSTDLLAAGPFGPPLAQAAAAAPQSTASDSASGPLPTTPQQSPSTVGANGSPQRPSTAPSLSGTSQQTQHAGPHSTAQSTASASDAANGAKTKADMKAGKRTGPFATAGSKIKNFFTGHKDSGGDDANSAPTQEENR